MISLLSLIFLMFIVFFYSCPSCQVLSILLLAFAQNAHSALTASIFAGLCVAAQGVAFSASEASAPQPTICRDIVSLGGQHPSCREADLG
jgi:hypothetical protein